MFLFSLVFALLVSDMVAVGEVTATLQKDGTDGPNFFKDSLVRMNGMASSCVALFNVVRPYTCLRHSTIRHAPSVCKMAKTSKENAHDQRPDMPRRCFDGHAFST